MTGVFHLDTHACVEVLNGTSEALVLRLREHAASEIALSAVVRAELLYGARRSQRVSENLNLLRRFSAPFRIIPFDDRCAEHYGMIRAELEGQGRVIGPNDLLIAATARAHDAVLVTSNTDEFSRVAGLAIEDWQS